MLRAVTLEDFVKLDIKAPPMLLSPIIPSQAIVMLFAERGVGKTHVALGAAYAVASGGALFRWENSSPKKVLYVDGEMAAFRMQERLQRLAIGRNHLPSPDFFRLVTPDLQEHGIPDLCTEEGQRQIDDLVLDSKLIVLDNLSTLARSGDENDAQSWLTMQTWLLRLRARGKSVLLVHHAGKSGSQRGTSRREDILDTVVQLRRPDDYSPGQGARFTVSITKGRHIHGEDAENIEAVFRSTHEGVKWDWR